MERLIQKTKNTIHKMKIKVYESNIDHDYRCATFTFFSLSNPSNVRRIIIAVANFARLHRKGKLLYSFKIKIRNDY